MGVKWYLINIPRLACGPAVETDHIGALSRSDCSSHYTTRAILQGNTPVWLSRLPDHTLVEVVLAVISHPHQYLCQSMSKNQEWMRKIDQVIPRVIFKHDYMGISNPHTPPMGDNVRRIELKKIIPMDLYTDHTTWNITCIIHGYINTSRAFGT